MADTIKPSCSFKNLTDGQTLSKTYRITVIARDNRKIAKVVLKIDGHAWGTQYISTYDFDVDTTDFANGPHTVTARAYDAAGNYRTISANVKIDNTVAPVVVVPVSEYYDQFVSTYTLKDGQTSSDGKEKCIYTGYGLVESNGQVLHLVPRSAQGTSTTNTDGSTSGTSAALVQTTQKVGANYEVEVEMTTVKQVADRTPNAWEVAWTFFKEVDSMHHYSFLIKPNGYELGKKDNLPGDTYPEHQIFLKTDKMPAGHEFALGRTYKVKFVVKANLITVYVDGQLLTTVTDTTQTPVLRDGLGSIGLYTEDADVFFDNLKITSL